MSATDELRKLLDERGVEWWMMHDVENGYHQDRDTEFLVYGCKHVAHEWGCRLQVDMLTPEQAIAATLGSDDRYDAGFSNGVQAVFQQLEGIEDYEQLQDLIAEYWAEGEGNNEHINALDRCKRGSDNRCIRNGFTTGGW